jgi:hypothetical protein
MSKLPAMAASDGSPSRFTNGRTARLEEQFVELTGAPPFEEAWRGQPDAVRRYRQELTLAANAALRLTARGWETRPLAAPDGSGAFVAALI